MIYLMLYLALGLVYAITGMVVWREMPFLRRLLCVVALWIFWPLMVAAIIHEKWVLRKLVGKCAWCGELVEDAYPVGNESWRKHALECKQHPLRAELTKTEHRAIAAENELDYLRWLLGLGEEERR